MSETTPHPVLTFRVPPACAEELRRFVEAYQHAYSMAVCWDADHPGARLVDDLAITYRRTARGHDAMPISESSAMLSGVLGLLKDYAEQVLRVHEQRVADYTEAELEADPLCRAVRPLVTWAHTHAHVTLWGERQRIAEGSEARARTLILARHSKGRPHPKNGLLHGIKARGVRLRHQEQL